MAGFKIPLDAMVVAVPCAYALFAMSGLVFKTLTSDPEISRMEFYDRPEAEVRSAGKAWKDSVRGLFEARINAQKTGVFNNEFKL